MNFNDMPYYGDQCEVDYYSLLHERITEAIDDNTMTKDLLDNLKKLSYKLYYQEYIFCFGSDDDTELQYLSSSSDQTNSIIDQNQDIILKLLLDFSPTKELFDELNNDHFRTICNFKEQYQSKPTYYREYMPLFLYLLSYDLFYLTNQLLTYLKINNTFDTNNTNLSQLITNLKNTYFKSFNEMMNKINNQTNQTNQTNNNNDKPKFNKCEIIFDDPNEINLIDDPSKKRFFISNTNV